MIISAVDVVDAQRDRVRTCVAGALAFGIFVLFWTIVNAVANGGAVDHDMTEAYVWGREFQLGYYKHPPFWAWIAGAWFEVLPHRAWAFAALSAINAGIGLIGAWFLIGRFTRDHKRVASILLLLLTPYYSWYAYRFNANTIFVSLWPWAAFFFVRSIEWTDFRNAVWFGILAALGLLSKYYAVLLLATCLFAACIHPYRDRYFRSVRPYVSIGVCAVLIAPHVWWLVRGGFQPFHYVDAEAGRSWLYALRQSANLMLESAAWQVPTVIVILLARQGVRRIWLAHWRDPRFRFLAMLCVAPLALTVACCLAFGLTLTSGTAIGTFCLMPLLLIELLQPDSKRVARIAGASVISLSVASLAVAPLVARAHVSGPTGMFRSIPSPDQPSFELAQAATRIWRETTGQPLKIVAGTLTNAGGTVYPDAYADAVVFYSDDRPSEFIDFDMSRAPWITRQRLEREGLLIVCPSGDRGCANASEKFEGPKAVRSNVKLLHRFMFWQGAPVEFTLTIVPPQMSG